jgi:hypothetical protein
MKKKNRILDAKYFGSCIDLLSWINDSIKEKDVLNVTHDRNKDYQIEMSWTVFYWKEEDEKI